VIYLTIIFLATTLGVSLLSYGACLAAKRSDRNMEAERLGFYMDELNFRWPE
jgi:hypothetical protein